MSEGKAIQIQTGQRGLALRSLDEMMRWAKGVAESGLAPKTLSTPSQILVATQYGMELGLTPMAALNSIAVIGNKPSLYGDAALALVRKSGFCEYVNETVTGDGDRMLATCAAKRKGQDEVVERTFSVADAKIAKLWGKAGPWQTHPKRMLQYKARAFCLRDLFPDVLMGLHIYEELQGEEPLEPTLEKPDCNTAPRSERRKPVESHEVAPITEEPEVLPPDMDAGMDADGGDTIDEPQPEPPAEDPRLVEIALKGVYNQFCQFMGLDGKDAGSGEAFRCIAKKALQCSDEDVSESKKFTMPMVTKVKAFVDRQMAGQGGE